jgi:hypothetical protein
MIQKKSIADRGNLFTLPRKDFFSWNFPHKRYRKFRENRARVAIKFGRLAKKNISMILSK